MQVLQQQFPETKNFKFRIFYTDFQPNIGNYATKAIKFFERTRDIVFIKVWNTQTFAGVGITTATLRIHDTVSLPITDDAQGEYGHWEGTAPSTGTSGLYVHTSNRTLTSSPGSAKIIGNMLTAYQVFVTLRIDNIGVIDLLTAGSFDIWIGTLKNP